MKRTLLLLVVPVLTVSPAMAQITITRADVDSYLDETITYTMFSATATAEAAAAVTATGANQSWDLSGFEWTSDSVYTAESVSAPVPGSDDPDFTESNRILQATYELEGDVDTLFQFMHLSDTAFALMGSFAHTDVGDLSLKYRPQYPVMKFPLTASSTWAYSGSFETSTGGFDLSTDWEETQEVVGWGDLVLPDGQGTSTQEALMIRQHLITTTEFPGIPAIVDTSITLHWVTKSGAAASAVEAGDGSYFLSYNVLSDVSVANEREEVLPRTVVLHQNHPNPFNPATTIRYDLIQPAHVTLSIYDAAGRQVAMRAEGQQAAGPHEVRWEAVGEAGRPLPSGVYLYRLEAVGADGVVTSASRTMVLLK